MECNKIITTRSLTLKTKIRLTACWTELKLCWFSNEMKKKKCCYVVIDERSTKMMTTKSNKFDLVARFCRSLLLFIFKYCVRSMLHLSLLRLVYFLPLFCLLFCSFFAPIATILFPGDFRATETFLIIGINVCLNRWRKSKAFFRPFFTLLFCFPLKQHFMFFQILRHVCMFQHRQYY